MKPIRVFEAIARRRIVIFGLLCILVISGSLGFGWDLYRNSKKAQAVPVRRVLTNGEIIKQTDTTDWSNYDVVIPNGVTATIDGEHAFNNLTIQNGGVLTSTDYNNYGIYNPGNPGDNLFENLLDSSDAQYTYIMRGFINVGINPATWIFSPCSGEPSEWGTANKPDSMVVDDIASLEFFAPISGDTTVYPQTLWTGTAVGHAFTSIDGGLVSFTDNVTDNSHQLLPFEMRFVNTGGPAQFGICRASAGPTLPANNFYLNNIDYSASFDVDDTSTAPIEGTTLPEMKSITAWQGASQNRYTGAITNYTSFSTYINNFKVNSGMAYNPAYFFQADGYDFKNDKKVSLYPSADHMLTNSRTFVTRTEQNSLEEYRRRYGVSINPYASFFPNEKWYSPLASRRTTHKFPNGSGGWHNILGYQPLLSDSLLATLPIKVPTKLTIAGTFRVENGGQVNLNGRGFATTMQSRGFDQAGLLPDEGSGPAGATYLGSGASHTGAGGDSKMNYESIAMNVYDVSDTVPPLLPGSGSIGWLAYQFSFGFFDIWGYGEEYTHQSQYDHGNGGGYINISAGKNELVNGSMIMANAVGADVNEAPPGASGGSIILADNNGSSFYNGLITAQGASTSRWHGDRTANGAGGGGYIFIITSMPTNNIKSRENTANHPPHDPPSIVKYPDWNYFDRMDMTTNSLSVTGGSSEDGRVGGIGKITVKRNIPPSVWMKKTLEPISRNGSADFNPYGLVLGDRIKVVIETKSLGPGDIITDEIPEVKLGVPVVKCVPVSPPDPGVPNYGGGYDVASGSVKWTHSGTDTERIFSYECVVSKI